MSPPGVYALFNPQNIMTFSSANVPIESALKSTFAFSSSSLSLPMKPSLSGSLSALSSIHSDHDYFIKASMNSVEYRMVSERHFYDVDNNNCGGDTMLSSCAIDQEKGTGEGTDTDFLKDLDDLNFSVDDLDPCCEVPMEDSFQEFIDSALEQSYPSFLVDISTDDKPVHGQDAVIFNKEQFLAILNLKPTQENQNSHDAWSVTSLTSSASSFIRSSSSLNKSTVDVNFNKASNFNANGAPSYGVVPTRQCSCLDSESVFKAVYSTAHSPQECVKMCPSTLVTNHKAENNNHPQCSLTPARSEKLMAPLFIDTYSSGLLQPLQSSPKDSLDIVVEEDSHWKVDNDTTDIMKWLSESQQEQPQQYSDSNNNIVNRLSDDEASHIVKTSNENNIATPSLDLESFVDLDDYETEMVDNNEMQHIAQDYVCERTTNQTKNNTSVPYVSQLKLSLLTERLSDNNNFRHGPCSDDFYESFLPEKLSPKSSDLSYCHLSPAWSRTDSIQSSVSPLPLASMDISWSSSYEDAIDDSSMKSPFALLNLFSDENATSLLHTDSAVPNIRFM